MPSDSILEFGAIRQLLDKCVVRSNYIVPNELVTPIRLTRAGEQAVINLRQKNKRIRPNEAKLAVSLRMGAGEELFVSDETNVGEIQQSVHHQILSKKIFYPSIYGRELADSIHAKYPNKRRLSARETAHILEQNEVGVFQHGMTTVGPFGCHSAPETRILPARLGVPGFACPDPGCKAIHSVELKTGETAISRAINTLSDVLEKSDPSDYAHRPKLFSRALGEYLGNFKIIDSASLISLIADSLEVGDLRSLVGNLLAARIREQTQRSFYSNVVGRPIANPKDLVSTYSRVQCLHLLLLFTDREIIGELDRLVLCGEMLVGYFELRSARLNRYSERSSRAELGSLGVRFGSTSSRSLIPRQLAELAEAICDGEHYSTEDLAFSLNDRLDAPIEQLIAKVYQEMRPEEFVDSVVMTNRHALTATKRHLGVASEDRDRARIQILWKIGADRIHPRSDMLEVLHPLNELKVATGEADNSRVRGHIANLFVALETVLQTSLQYTTWALMTDHYGSQDAFAFDADDAAGSLAEKLDVHGQFESTLWTKGEKPSLHALSSGFGRLAKKLLAVSSFDIGVRPRSQWPPSCAAGIRPFAFARLTMYENLDDSSKMNLVENARTLSRLGTNSILVGVRNAGLHGNNPFPEWAEISQCIEIVDNIVKLIGETGFYPKVYKLVDHGTDAQGRAWCTYASGDDSLQFQISSWPLTSRMPDLASEVIIFRAATNKSWGPLRFRLLAYRGSSEYWKGWPLSWSIRDKFDETSSQYSLTDMSDTD